MLTLNATNKLALGLSSLASLAIHLVVADHFRCTWTGPGNKAPDTYGFVQFCVAPARRNGTSNAVYLCNNADRTKVADWNYLAPFQLEFATPCAGGGYAGNLCDKSTYWAVCVLDHQGKTYCRYLAKSDDCQWEALFTSGTIPPAVAIYYH